MPRSSLTSALVLLFVTGCSEPPEEPAASGLEPVGDVRELMLSMIEPAAETYWDAVGWIVDSTGTEYFRPETAEDWEAVRNAAFVIAESGNLLMMEGRAIDDGPWMGLSRGMTDVAIRATSVADSRDEQGVFDMGAEIYASCTNCHARYAVETLRPNARLD